MKKSTYHPGEVLVQERAGARELAERTGRGIQPGIPALAREFVEAQPLAIVATVDEAGWPWASALHGAPGFLRVVDERSLLVRARPVPGDPLGAHLHRAADVGVLVMDSVTRRRLRINGKLQIDPQGFLQIRVEQYYLNCPKFIQARTWRAGDGARGSRTRRSRSLTPMQTKWIAEADTFFIASYHPDGGADASHRGGNPGFVEVSDGALLSWKDYAGNGMFQTLGNLCSYPRAGLLFIDFRTGAALQLTGRARLIWDGPDRRVNLEVEEAVEIQNAIGLAWEFLGYSPVNPE